MRNETHTERAFRRRFALLVHLHISPRSRDELLRLLDQEHLFLYDRATDAENIARQQRYQFRHDLAALRSLKCKIDYDRHQKTYSWHNSPFGLSLDLAQLTTFATLLDTFTDTTILHANEIQNLLTFFLSRLPIEQQIQLGKHMKAFRIDLQETTDYSNADPKTIKTVELAIRQGRRLQFSYCSPRDGKERCHVIEPYPLIFERGHVYLKGWSVDYEKELPFRLDYILPGTATVLPTSIAPHRSTARSYTLRYRLSAVIARNSVSEHFADQHIERHEDGSATITAQITDLFTALRTLISYREHCIVLEPAELVAQMRDCAEKLYEIYHTGEM
jgi:predicted DNA-binding transcriptional regulator YafY